MKYIFLFLYSFSAFALPELYEKKDYTKSKSDLLGDNYHYTYGFKDHLGAYREFRWAFNRWKSDSFLMNFGLGEKSGDRFHVGEAELEYSMMKIDGGRVAFDYSKVVQESKNIVAPLYLQFKSIQSKYNLNKRERIELIMRFLQDIPYGVPPTNYQSRYIGGLFPPSETLKNGWADCDSKSILMATLLSFDPYFYNKLAMILVPGHALLGIQDVPGPYDKSVRFIGRQYVYAEPVGLARTPYGKTNSPYSKSIKVIPLSLSMPEGQLSVEQPTIVATTTTSGSGNLSDEECPDNALKIEYKRPFGNEFVQSCQLKVDGKYVKHGPTLFTDASGNIKKKEVWKMGEKLSE
jgi:hypothetical protein